MSKWYHLFVLSLKWDSQIEIIKQCIPQNILFQQMTVLIPFIDSFWFSLITHDMGIFLI